MRTSEAIEPSGLVAVVLAGGKGTRLRPLTVRTPKPLLPLFERPLLDALLEYLHVQGVSDVILSLGYRPERFEQAYPEASSEGVRLHYVAEATPLGTGGALAYAARRYRLDEPFLVVNGDILTDRSVAELFELHRESRALATISLQPVAAPERFGVLELDDSGRVRSFLEKPAPGTTTSRLVNAGLYVVEPGFVEVVDEGREVSVEREVFPQLAERGRLFALAQDSYWLDAGTPEAYVQAHYDVLSGRYLAGRYDLVGTSWVHETAEVARSAELSYATVSAECVIEDGAVLKSAVVMEGARVGQRSSVDHAVVAPRGVVDADSLVGDFSIAS